MIEKKIHYIWFGGEKPEKVKKCIESWRKFLPDYEIIEWNERNIDIEKERKNNKFFKLCYDKKIYGVATDYLRTKIIYENGGIYFDTDIEVIKSFNPLLDNKLFFGYEKESENYICYAVIGSIPKHPFLEKMLNFYEKKVMKSKLFISTGIIKYVLEKYYSSEKLLYESIKIYPQEYFFPYDWDENFTEECIKENTYCIHRWDGSWTESPNRLYLKYKHLNPILRYFKIKRKMKKMNKK